MSALNLKVAIGLPLLHQIFVNKKQKKIGRYIALEIQGFI